jgi:putative transposase
VGKNPTDRGKNGTKRSLLVEGQGGPLGLVIAGANVHDAKLLRATLEAVVVERPEPTPAQPQHLCLDAGYDNPSGHEAPAAFGYTARTSAPSGRRRRRTARRGRTGRGAGWWSERWLG